MMKSKLAPTELEQIEDLKKIFKKNKVIIKKYNYAIDDMVQNFSCFDAFLQLSEDEQHLIITNKKPVDNQEYILESDPEAVRLA